MSRRLALLPFEISRAAPDPLPVFEDEPEDEENGELLGDEARQEADDAALAAPALTEEAEALAAAEEEWAAGEEEIAAEGSASGEAVPAPDAPEDVAASAGTSAGGGDAGPLESADDSQAFEAPESSEDSESSEASEHTESPEAPALADAEQLFADASGAETVDEAEPDPLEGDERAPLDHAWLARADRVALARWIREELAAILAATGAIAPTFLELDEEAEAESEELDDLELALAPEPIALALAEAGPDLGLELGLACRLRADAHLVELSALLADRDGEERVRLTTAAHLGDAHRLPRQMARDLLFALGDDAAAAAIAEPVELDLEEAELPAAAEAMLELVRGARSLDEARTAPEGSPLADPAPALRELLEALTLSPTLLPARDRLLRAALDALGSGAMPAWLSGLEQLVQLRPADCQALLALAAYRRAHRDPEGARDLLLRARDLATAGSEEALVLGALAALAEEQGRDEEAIQHLRAAVRVDDDAALYLRLGQLLRERDPHESVRALQRAAVLAPESARLRLELALQLTRIGETARAATEAAQAARLGQGDPETTQAADELLRGLIDAAQLQPD